MMPQASPSRLPVRAILFLTCLFLAGALAYRHRVATAEKAHSARMIHQFSNQWAAVSEKLREQKSVNLALEREVATQAEELRAFSNTVAVASADLYRSESNAKAAGQAAQGHIARQDERIVALENERDDMSKSIASLTDSISSLETQIAETEQKLATSTTDREFLLAELKRLQSEKAELERRFNDLALLRQQVRKLRDELSVSRRLEWMRRGSPSRTKGAEMLRQGMASVTPETAKFNLDVEVRRDQTSKVLPPTAP